MTCVTSGSGAFTTEGGVTAAARDHEDLAAAMATCADAIPCWIMPTWRISQCLPARLAAFDLVVLDEASKNDVSHKDLVS